MCCCRLTSCCCGCQPLQPGCFVLAVLNLVVNLALLLLPWFMVTVVDHSGYVGWLAILMAADVGMAVGAKTGIKVLLLPWLIFYCINVVFSLLLAPIVIFLGVAAARALR